MQLFNSRVRIPSLLFTTITFTSKVSFRTLGFHSSLQVVHVLPHNIRGGGYSDNHKISNNIRLFASGVNGENSSSSSSSSSNIQGNNRVNREGQTGWNHNLPKETSSFWKSSDGGRGEGATKANQEQKADEEPKTGWLHTKPKKIQDVEKSDTGIGKKSSSSSLSKALQLLEEAKMKQKINHRIISPPTFHACEEGRRAVITEHYISVPLQYIDNDGNNVDESSEKIDVYFSIVDLITSTDDENFFLSLQKKSKSNELSSSLTQSKVARVNEQQNRASAYKQFINMKNADQCILYLQGGPGFGAPQPINGIGLGSKSSWVGAALGKGYKRVVLMDQRGTGKSTTITKQTLEKKFPDLFLLDDIAPKIWDEKFLECSSMESVNDELSTFDQTHPKEAQKVRNALKEATNYLTYFRADNIVRDAELIKDALLQPLEDDNDSALPRPWGAALGQSFGGFCMMSYLSLIKNPPKICLLTGGIAPMLTNVDKVYSALRERVKQRNLKYFDRYPGDINVVKRIISKLQDEHVKLPSGGILTARRFQQIGISLGGSPSSFASLHSLFSSAFISEDDDDFSRAFLKSIDSIQPFDDHPIYFLLHESIYADMNSECRSSNWSAMRAYDISPDFKVSKDCVDKDEPTLLVGEVVFPWMADGDYAELNGLSMRAISHTLSTKDDWGKLYDASKMRSVLATDGSGVSKAAAAVYYDDMYVDFDASMEVTKRGNPLENCAVWITNDYQHSGLRDDGAAIFSKLLGMAKGEIGTPS